MTKTTAYKSLNGRFYGAQKECAAHDLHYLSDGSMPINNAEILVAKRKEVIAVLAAIVEVTHSDTFMRLISPRCL